MKSIALATTGAALVLTASLASAHTGRVVSTAPTASMPIRGPSLHGLRLRRVLVPLQTGAATPTSGPTATPRPTTSPYPDPVTVLQSMFTKYGLTTWVHFQDRLVANQPGVVKITVKGQGLANCTSIMATVSGTKSLTGTAQRTKVHYEFIEKKTQAWKKQLRNDKTHHRWQRSLPRSVETPFTDVGDVFSNPLACPNTPSSAGPPPNESLKDLANLGPVTVAGVKTWHIHGTLVISDSTGSNQAALDMLISQAQFLPYDYKLTFHDAQSNATLVFDQAENQFGTKGSIPTPKIGSTTP